MLILDSLIFQRIVANFWTTLGFFAHFGEVLQRLLSSSTTTGQRDCPVYSAFLTHS